MEGIMNIKFAICLFLSLVFISALSLFLIPSFALCATFCVSDATELQSALTTAESNGEDNTIKIVQGTYSGNFTYASTEGYGLTVEGGYSQDCGSRTIDPVNTILDGGGTDTVLALASQGGVTFSVEGLTFQNGNASTVTTGGGLYAGARNGSMTLTNNTFTGNTARSGGGVYLYGSSIRLTNNTFTGNTGSDNGGGIFISTYNPFTYRAGTSTLTNNIFTRNTATTGSGGGVYVYIYNGTSTLTNNIFTRNTANSGGGGTYISSFRNNVILTNNTLASNTAETEGGGVWLKLLRLRMPDSASLIIS